MGNFRLRLPDDPERPLLSLGRLLEHQFFILKTDNAQGGGGVKHLACFLVQDEAMLVHDYESGPKNIRTYPYVSHSMCLRFGQWDALQVGLCHLLKQSHSSLKCS